MSLWESLVCAFIILSLWLKFFITLACIQFLSSGLSLVLSLSVSLSSGKEQFNSSNTMACFTSSEISLYFVSLTKSAGGWSYKAELSKFFKIISFGYIFQEYKFFFNCFIVPCTIVKYRPIWWEIFVFTYINVNADTVKTNRKF